MPRRLALLVATYRYQDEELQQLTAPGHDAEGLAEALRNPDIAGFDVTVKLNEPCHVVGQAIGEFFHKRRRDDLTLLYFTGHGLKDDQGRLYLAMTDTRHDQLLFTGLSANTVNEAMEASSSRQQLLILDCCYSGAYPADRIPKADTKAHSLTRFEGTGRVILTASDSIQYAFQGGEVTGEGSGSVFTRYLVEGLTTGEADLDGDGNIALDELYAYAYDHVVAAEPRQHPQMLEHVEGRIVLAHNVHWTLPDHIRHAVQSPFKEQRLAALEELKHLHVVGNDRVRTEVVNQTRALAADDSKTVSLAASKLLTTLEGDGVKSQSEKVAAEEQARRQAEAERARRAEERQAQQEAEQARQREAEAEATRQREAEAEAARQREAEAEAEATRQREAEAEAARQREAEAEQARQRQAEAEQARERQAEQEAAQRMAQEQARLRQAEQEAAQRRAEAQARQRHAEERARGAADTEHAGEGARRDAQSARFRWVAVGLLVVAIVVLAASASGVLDTLRLSRPQQPAGDAWLAMLWLVPAIPAVIAAGVLLITRASGVAVGCVVLAFLIVGASELNLVLLTDSGARAVHLALLIVLAAASVFAAIGTPAVCARVGLNRAPVLALALALVAIAIGLGVAVANDPSNSTPLTDRPAFWTAVLTPLFISLPGAVIRGNPTQARAMLTVVGGYTAFLLLLLAGRLIADTEVPSYETVNFIANVCMVLAVLIGQLTHLRSPQPPTSGTASAA